MIAQIRLDVNKGGDFSLAMKEIDQIRQVDVTEPVRVIGQKLILAFEKFLDRFQSLCDIGSGAGIDEMNAPILDIAAQQLDILAAV